jgi:hypothetical protein
MSMRAAGRGRETHPGISRTTDRRITAAGLLAAGIFMVLAAAAALLPSQARHGIWLPLHLALAGAGGTAVAAAMPFFSGALTTGRPADVRLRVLALTGVALGAALVTTGFDAGADPIAAIGGLCYLMGLVALLGAVLQPLRTGLGPHGWIVVAAYVVATLDVLGGVAIATGFVGRMPPITSAWATLKPAHAWLGLLGFLSLVVAGSLVHLLPTALGTRIRTNAGALLAIGGGASGPPLVAAGFVLRDGALADFGAAATLAGAIGMVAYALHAFSRRGRWTTDPGWHLLVLGHLLAAVGWYGLAALLACGRVVIAGVSADGWRLADVAGPLVVGWVVGSILGAWAHLLPAIGPGDAPAHAVQRRILGRWALGRLLGFQLGTCLLSVGLAGGSPVLSASGLVVVLAAGSIDLALLAAATRVAVWGRSS